MDSLRYVLQIIWCLIFPHLVLIVEHWSRRLMTQRGNKDVHVYDNYQLGDEQSVHRDLLRSGAVDDGPWDIYANLTRHKHRPANSGWDVCSSKWGEIWLPGGKYGNWGLGALWVIWETAISSSCLNIHCAKIAWISDRNSTSKPVCQLRDKWKGWCVSRLVTILWQRVP